MKRRSFLRTGSAVALPIALNGFGLSYLRQSAIFNSVNPDSDRVLVLIQLDGGNDGLNTLIPLDQYDNLYKHRSNIIVPEGKILPFTDTIGLHPAMTGFQALFDQGKLAVVQGVAYPNQNRSHFRSTDIWQTGSAADQFETTGWLGRLLDRDHEGFPEGYPNESYPDPFAITLQYTVSETCQGTTSNYSMAVTDPFSLGQIDEATLEELPDTNFGKEMAFLIDAIAQTNAYSQVVVDAANKGNNLSARYDANDQLAQQLKTVALLISGGLKTRVYVVRIGGFDTHANQVEEGDTDTGMHASLLSSLSGAVGAFQDDLRLLGLEERVLGMTFSEFGRQIGANDSLGTDHGTAAPLFLFGGCVNGGIYADGPVIPDQLEPSQGVAMQVDYRTVYASVLRNWFEIEDDEVDGILFGHFGDIGFVNACQSTDVNDPVSMPDPFSLTVYPNPVRDQATLRMSAPGGTIQLDLFDIRGRKLMNIYTGQAVNGWFELPYNAREIPSGQYVIRALGKSGMSTTRFVKL